MFALLRNSGSGLHVKDRTGYGLLQAPFQPDFMNGLGAPAFTLIDQRSHHVGGNQEHYCEKSHDE